MKAVDAIAKASNWETVELTSREATEVAKRFKHKRPRMGYMLMVSESPALWLSSANHFQFGSLGRPKGAKPFTLWRSK